MSPRAQDGHFFPLLQVADDKALVFHPHADKPQAVPLDVLAANFAGKLILMTTRERVAGAQRAFDVTWFIPSLVKYRQMARHLWSTPWF